MLIFMFCCILQEYVGSPFFCFTIIFSLILSRDGRTDEYASVGSKEDESEVEEEPSEGGLHEGKKSGKSKISHYWSLMFISLLKFGV